MAETKSRRSSGDDRLDLASAFPAASDDAWRSLVSRILGDGDFEQTLARRTYDDIVIQPLYTATDWQAVEEPSGFPGMAPFTRGQRVIGQTASGWDIRQCQAHPDPSRCNKAVLEDLERGVTSIDLRFDQAGLIGLDGDDADAAETAGSGGVMISSIDDLDNALKDVPLDACPVGIWSGAAFLPAAAMMLGLATRRGLGRDAFAAALNADPLGALAELGMLTTTTEDALAQLGLLARHVAEAFPAATAAAVDATVYHDAGASEAQELACAMATGTAYLRAMTDAGLDTGAAFGQIAFTFASDANLFLSIAKLRAVRRMWGRVAEACGVLQAVRDMRLHAVTSYRMLARRDPWVNILRATVATLAASVAGADSIIVRPFTAAIGLPDSTARRIARNTQLVLQQESFLYRVIDPAGGSWALENLTEAMAREAWTQFRAIEAEGGMPAAIESGRIRERIAAVAARRERQIAALGDPITGTSTFPDLTERPASVEAVDLAKLRKRTAARLTKRRRQLAQVLTDPLAALADASGGAMCEAAITAALAGASLGDIRRAAARSAPARVAPLPRHRLSEAFEVLRDLSDAYLERSGRRPTVFLATIGSLARHGAAASYTRNFLAAGGIEAVAGEGGPDAESIAAAFRSSRTDVAVICSDAADYREIGADLVAALGKAGAREIYVGGPADKAVGSADAPGVKGFLHEGCDVVATLRDMLQGMGILRQ